MSMWRGWTGATQSSLVDPRAGYGLTQAVYDGLMGHRVKDNHVFTARMCAASRCLESSRRDRLFADPVSELLAGWEGMEAPMGSWILIPRTSYGDGVLQRAYHTDARTAARQLVLLGAGMDSRAYRPELNVPELRVFEVDHGENFRVKEAILQHPAVQAAFPLAVASRQVVSTDFAEAGQAEDCQPRWARDLCAAGFDPGVPSVWLLEGGGGRRPEQGRRTESRRRLDDVPHRASADAAGAHDRAAQLPRLRGFSRCHLGFVRQQAHLRGRGALRRRPQRLPGLLEAAGGLLGGAGRRSERQRPAGGPVARAAERLAAEERRGGRSMRARGGRDDVRGGMEVGGQHLSSWPTANPGMEGDAFHGPQPDPVWVSQPRAASRFLLQVRRHERRCSLSSPLAFGVSQLHVETCVVRPCRF
ncbi:unnamed protein product [Prorocentrum cordatum]|uniref:[Phosphatase 2A protein]-leucine-carboxy methyltransferase 1 n=1 Tax=Prorocentrum cordatum TaxID=2364126 RepID=A0ABN9UB88_9DINO|nr:unnamed protein product [Polarella glacialis]